MAPAPPPQDPGAVGGIPAGYGRSCTNCSRSKCRCILRPAGGKCDRCHRLGKDCQTMVTSRKRVGKRTKASRTAQLEEKLDDLVSILRATQPQQPGQSTTEPPIDKPVRGPCAPWLSRLDSLADAATTSQPQPRPSVLGYSITLSLSDSDRLPEPQPSEAEVYLAKFRQWLELFPFMHLSADLTAEALRRESPFLWLCIMNITTMSMPQKSMLRDRIRQELAQRVVINHERSMDVLLGLVTYLAWASMNAVPGSRPFLTLYTQLANCIIYEQDLTRSPHDDHYPMVSYKTFGIRPQPPPKRCTMEERRTVLSFWFLSSVCSSFLGKTDTLVWTPHLQDGLDLLEREKEYPSDEILVTLLKLQLICEEAQKLLIRDMVGRNVSGRPPTYVFKKTLLAQLQGIREAVSPALTSKHLIKTHLLGTETLIQAVGLFGRAKAPDALRVDGMYACLASAAAWYEAFFTLPLTDIPGLPFPVYVELSQIQAFLFRLAVVEDPAWDKEVVRNTTDILDYVDRSIEMMEKVDAIYPLRCENIDTSIFAVLAKVMRHSRVSWGPLVSQNLGVPTPNSQAVSSVTPQSTLVGDPIMADQGAPADFNDFAWMSDIFCHWES